MICVKMSYSKWNLHPNVIDDTGLDFNTADVTWPFGDMTLAYNSATWHDHTAHMHATVFGVRQLTCHAWTSSSSPSICHHHPRHLPPPKMSRGCSHCCHCWPFSQALRVKDWSATRTLPSGAHVALMVKDWSAAFSMHRHLPLQGHHGYQYAGVTNTKNWSCSVMGTHISGFDGNSHHADNI